MVGYGTVGTIPLLMKEERKSSRKYALAALGLAAVGAFAVVGMIGSRRTVLEQAKPNFVPLQPAGEMGTNRAFLGKSDGAGQSTKGRMVMLAATAGDDQVNLGYVPLPDYGSWGTNTAFLGTHDGQHQSTARDAKRTAHKVPVQATRMGTDAAFMGKADGAGQSTKGTFQMLDQDVKLNYIPLPSAGTLGTNTAFIGKGDGSGQSTKSKMQSLLVGSFPVDTSMQKHPMAPRGFGNQAANQGAYGNGFYSSQKATKGQRLARNFGTNAAFMGKYDGAGQSTKGQTTMLYPWNADMEGTYLPASPALTGEGTTQANLIGPPFATSFTDATNLGGIPGKEPANVLYPGIYKSNGQQLYQWTADMEGTYLPASPALTGEGTVQANLIGPPFATPFTDATNLGGIPGKEPANVLYPGIY